MKNSIKIPVALQIRVDDVGWHIGADDRWKGQPSRSGLPRNHNVLDYHVLHELGKGLDMKINCSLVLGEWDKENILRGQNHLTYEPDTWDRKSKIDLNYAEKAFETLENSEYIAYTCHGVLHGHYDKGKCVTEREFYNKVYSEAEGREIFTWHTDEVFKNHLDYFFKIYNMWGFKKPVYAFACGCGSFGLPEAEGNVRYCEMLSDYGIFAWQNGWGAFNDEGLGRNMGISHDVVCMKGAAVDGGKSIPWDAYGVDPKLLNLYYKEENPVAYPDLCIHWTNLLRWNPENNMELIGDWIAYFKRQSEEFGCMLSKDILFAASQIVYSAKAKMEFEGNKCIIDLKDVDASGAKALKNEFYISFKNDTVPKECKGGEIKLFEEKKNFKTYKITRETGYNKVEITL